VVLAAHAGIRVTVAPGVNLIPDTAAILAPHIVWICWRCLHCGHL
jgi:hypothetical protein